jgi:hypothetical protein
MFETLEEQIQEVEGAAPTRGKRILKYLALLVISLVVFGGLYFAIRLLG